MELIKKIKNNRNLAIGISVAAFVLILTIIIVIIELNKFPMPDLKGLDAKEATEILEEKGVDASEVKFNYDSKRITKLDSSKFIIEHQSPEAGEKIFASTDISLELKDENSCKSYFEKLVDKTVDKAIKEIDAFNKSRSTKFVAFIKDQDGNDVTDNLMKSNDKERAKWQVTKFNEVMFNDEKVSFSVDTVANIQKKKAEEEAKKKAEEEKQKAEKEKSTIEDALGSTVYDFQKTCEKYGWKAQYSVMTYSSTNMKTFEPFPDKKNHWSLSDDGKRPYSGLFDYGFWEGYNAEDDEGEFGFDGYTGDLKSSIFALYAKNIDVDSKTVYVYINNEKFDVEDYFSDNPSKRNNKLVLDSSEVND